MVLPYCRNLAVSEAIAKALPASASIIENPFENHIFSRYSKEIKDRDIVFMGRLVSDKGCDLLLQALALLKQQGIEPLVSVIGDGDERRSLEELSLKLGLASQVRFLGTLTEGRAIEVARHKILVVPSRWIEPFGIVALEGIAAGCVVVASSQGGLREAVGECGVLFTSGDVGGLAEAIRGVYLDSSRREELTARRAQHLSRFDPRLVADRYIEIFESLI